MSEFGTGEFDFKIATFTASAVEVGRWVKPGMQGLVTLPNGEFRAIFLRKRWRPFGRKRITLLIKPNDEALLRELADRR